MRTFGASAGLSAEGPKVGVVGVVGAVGAVGAWGVL